MRRRWPLLAPLLLVAASTAHGAQLVAGAAAAKKVQPRFTVRPSKSRYKLGEQVVLKLKLTLRSGARTPSRVTTYPTGTVHVVVVRRRRLGRAQRIGSHSTRVRFLANPFAVQVQALRTLSPGKSVAIPYDVELDGHAGVLLRDVHLHKRREHVALVYKLSGPGSYAVRLAYEYTGGAGGKSHVLRGRLLSNTAKFRLVR